MIQCTVNGRQLKV